MKINKYKLISCGLIIVGCLGSGIVTQFEQENIVASVTKRGNVGTQKKALNASIQRANTYHAQYWTPISFGRLQSALVTAKRLNGEWWAPQWKINQANQVLQSALNKMYPAYRNIMNGSNIFLPNQAQGKKDKLLVTELTSTGKGTQFKDSAYDQAIKVNYRWLSSYQQKELTAYATNLINNMRKQLGTPMLGISQGAIMAANQVAKGYESDNWSLWYQHGHDIQVLSQVLGQYQNVSDWSEDATAFGSDGSVFGTTLSGLKYQIYQSIYLMIFQDNAENYVHVKSLLGINDLVDITGKTNCYLGLAFDKLGTIHFEILHATNIFNPNKIAVLDTNNVLYTTVKTF